MKAKLLKRILFAAFAGTAVFCMTACGGTNGSEGTAADPAEESTNSQETEETADTEPADSTKDGGESRGGEGSALIAYFSWSVLRNHIQRTMMNFWTLPGRNRAAMPVRLLQTQWTCQDMTRFIWDSPIGGAICL